MNKGGGTSKKGLQGRRKELEWALYGPVYEQPGKNRTDDSITARWEDEGPNGKKEDVLEVEKHGNLLCWFIALKNRSM